MSGRRDPSPSGLILLDKKAGLTSFEALGEIKRSLGTGKVGHTGTLDKFASGLLLVLAGRALKLSLWFSHCDKQYSGRIRFGLETDTLDPEGQVVGEAAVPSREKVEQVLRLFMGETMQEPPVYSAIHVGGKRASALAREGNPPVMKKRPVHIYGLELRSWEPPFAEIFVHCSSGTYIRSLVRDIAIAAESRACLYGLRRTKVAGFSLDMADNGGQINPIDKTVIGALGFPWFELSPAETENIIHGRPLSPLLDGKPLLSHSEAKADVSMAAAAAVFSGDTLAAIVEKNGSLWEYGCVM
ncbi:MAG: tRNA pseudouridine(55) synthase TruB [Treponema sp.]|jgi:tRNA pseudouridine55 synthase|nr:tRNA pseudouridine(55) synthase TruB [Treponema sp.]